MPIEALPHVRRSIHALLKEDLPADVPIVLATLSESMKVGPLTTDREVIHAAVDAIPAATKPHLTLMDILEHLQMVADTGGNMATQGAPAPMVFEALSQGRRLITENRLRLLAVSESLT